MSLRRLVPIALAALASLPARPADGQARVLTKEAEAGFRQFIQRVQHGALGPAVVNANVGMNKSEANIELVLASGRRKPVRVLPFEADGAWKSRTFAITPKAPATLDDARRIGELLEQCFPTDPFVIATHEVPIEGIDGRSLSDALRQQGPYGAAVLALDRSFRPLGHTALALIISLHLLGVLACLLAFLRAKPRVEPGG